MEPSIVDQQVHEIVNCMYFSASSRSLRSPPQLVPMKAPKRSLCDRSCLGQDSELKYRKNTPLNRWKITVTVASVGGA